MKKRTITSVLVIAFTVMAKGGDWKNLASGLEWSFPKEEPSIVGSMYAFMTLSAERETYRLALKTSTGKLPQFMMEISKGRSAIHSWPVHPESMFVVHKGLLVYVGYLQMSSGCGLTVFDLKAKKILWQSQLYGIGPVDHSVYRNRVYFCIDRFDRIIVKGYESSGKYIEMRDLRTGQLLGYKVFDLSKAEINRRKERLSRFKQLVESSRSTLSDEKAKEATKSLEQSIRAIAIQADSESTNALKESGR